MLPDGPAGDKTPRRLPWFKFYTTDWLIDTKFMPRIEEVYVHALLAHFYEDGGRPLPTDLVKIYRLLGAITDEEQGAVDNVLLAYCCLLYTSPSPRDS